MDMCDALENWENLTRDNKLEAVQDLLAHMASDYDVPVPEVRQGVPDLPDTPKDESTNAGAYDADNNVLYLNENLLNAANSSDQAMSVAGHEFAHELYASQVDDEEYDSKASEDYAQTYGDQMRDEIADYCKNPPPPQSPGAPDSGGDGDGDGDGEEEGGPGDWNLVPPNEQQQILADIMAFEEGFPHG